MTPTETHKNIHPSIVTGGNSLIEREREIKNTQKTKRLGRK